MRVKQGPGRRKGCAYFVVGLSIQTSCGDKARAILSARLEQDQIAGKGLVFLHLHHISNLLRGNDDGQCGSAYSPGTTSSFREKITEEWPM